MIATVLIGVCAGLLGCRGLNLQDGQLPCSTAKDDCPPGYKCAMVANVGKRCFSKVEGGAADTGSSVSGADGGSTDLMSDGKATIDGPVDLSDAGADAGASVDAGNVADAGMDVGLMIFTLSVQSTGGGSVTGTGGISCTMFPCNTGLNMGSSVTLTATPGPDYTFVGWSGQCSSASGSTTGGTCVISSIGMPTMVTAAFILKTYNITIQVGSNGSVSGPGVNCTNPTCVVMVNSGTNLTLTANPPADSMLSGWSGDCTGTGTCTLSNIMADKMVTAGFMLKAAGFSIIKAGAGSGTVTANWTGGSLNCGTNCSAQITPGTSVTLTATPSPGSTVSWSACGGTGPCTVTVGPSVPSVTATFTLLQFPISVQPTGAANAGSIISTTAGVGISCGAICAATVNYGSALDLLASPAANSVFDSWTNCPNAGQAKQTTCSVTVTAATGPIKAVFKHAAGGSCGGTADCTTGFCVNGICCSSGCNGKCDRPDHSCAAGSGACLHLPARTQCGTAPSTSPGSNDVELICDDVGTCAGPTIDCGGIPRSCQTGGNRACCVPPGVPGDPSNYQCTTFDVCNNGFQKNVANCLTTRDCPIGQVCCVAGGLGAEPYLCLTSCTGPQLCSPDDSLSICPAGKTCKQSPSGYSCQ